MKEEKRRAQEDLITGSSSREDQMEKNPPRVSCKYASRHTRKISYTVDESEDTIECSGKYCQSCTAGLIADCIALCCCPCALVNLFTLAFVKVPWTIGRRCLGRVKKKTKNKNKKKPESDIKCKKNSSSSSEGDNTMVVERDEKLRKRREEEEIWEIETVFSEVEDMARFSAKLEAERVWLELYQVGHLGFGRVSFTGI
ncbi:hypothetical protein K2173_020357 [Erythroxylum novogranatense]|uniref:Uncharacterized protein n=1 Tax=Erythroxylum novogranatense TaxID=1862640 RepID=A0AAV8UC69_9ROSI|nr:hypothetical protein K2173_020357 [Erythroxylum novogranatense]